MKITSTLTIENDDLSTFTCQFIDSNSSVKRGTNGGVTQVMLLASNKSKILKAFDLLVKTEELSETKSKEVQTT